MRILFFTTFVLIRFLLVSHGTRAVPQGPDYPTPAVTPGLTKYEYFFDTDPGFEAGTPVTLTGTNATDNATIDITALPNGVHSLFIRSKDANGNWSITNRRTFVNFEPAYPAVAVEPSIEKVEYFFDVDPGVGAATEVAITPSPNVSNLSLTIMAPASNLVHQLFVRTKDSEKRWSITNARTFGNLQPAYNTPPAPSNITRIEYFFDADPGFKQGTAIAPLPVGSFIEDFTATIDKGALSAGDHTLFIRSLSSGWALTNVAAFLIEDVLPVTLVGFFGKYEAGVNKLTWRTASEFENSHFEIERAIWGDEPTFIKIGQVDGKGTTTNASSYNFTDESPGPAKNYYRLRQVDFNHQFSFSDIIAIEGPHQTNRHFYIYPNPAKNVLHLGTNHDPVSMTNAEFFITDLLGANIPISSKFTNGLPQWDIRALAPGMYLLQAIINNQRLAVAFIKQ